MFNCSNLTVAKTVFFLLCNLLKLSGHICVGLFLESLFYFIYLSYVYPFASTTVLILVTLYLSLKVVFDFSSIFLFQNCFDQPRSFAFLKKFYNHFVNSAVEVFLGIALNLQINLRRINTIILMNLLIHECNLPLHLLKSDFFKNQGSIVAAQRSYTYFVTFICKYFIWGSYCKCFFNWVFNCLLLVYRNMVDFFWVDLELLIKLFYSVNFLWNSWDFLYRKS